MKLLGVNLFCFNTLMATYASKDTKPKEYTYLDRGYLFNFLSGKEWLVGKRRQNMFNLNVRLFFQGGDRYTPIDEEKSKKDLA